MSQNRRSAKGATILHIDSELVVVDKPAGVLSAAGRGAEIPLPQLLRARPEFADDEPLRIVHRLDRDASGVIVYARTLEAQRHLVRQFGRQRVQKLYQALVRGYVAADGEVELPLRYNKRAGRMLADEQRGKPALTRYRILRRVPGNTWLECRPLTGRTHQIRVHLAAIGHPLTVDPLYGSDKGVLLSTYKPDYRRNTRRAERPLIDRLTLHAARVEFQQRLSGALMAFEAPLPKDLRATLNQLGRLA